MAILPFVDRTLTELNRKVKVNNTVDRGTTSSGHLFRHAQGVSVKTYTDDRCRLLPLLSTNGFPRDSVSQVIDHQLEDTFFGYVQEFLDPLEGNELFPFEDISSGRDPVSFLKDDGITAYPQVWLNPNYLNPGFMNGIIEPLEVRGTMAGTSIDSPFVAHTIRAALMDTPQQYKYHLDTNSGKENLDVEFIDSQDTAMSNQNFKLHDDGISDFGERSIAPYDDLHSKTKITNDLMFQDESTFNDFIGVGIISKGAGNTVFDYKRDRSVVRGKTGIRNVSDVNSLVYGGLMR